MTGKIKNMVDRNGRYHARLVVPTELQGVVGKAKLRTPLGGDYRQALKLHPGEVAKLQNQIGLAERQARQGKSQAIPARYPLAPDQLAHSHYMQRLAFDGELRNDIRYATFGYVDELLVARLRKAKPDKTGLMQTKRQQNQNNVNQYRSNYDVPLPIMMRLAICNQAG